MANSTCYDRMKEVKDFDESKAGVKGLSDSGVPTIPKFFIHPPHSLSSLSSSSSAQIPTIDLSHSQDDVVGQVRDAAQTWGFFQITNHGIPVQFLNDTVSAVKAFHSQPSESKSKFYSRVETRGAMYASNNDLFRGDTASWHDSLQVWTAPSPAPPDQIPEVWRDLVFEWDARVKRVADKVMELLALGLGLDSRRFKELTFGDRRLVVGHIYPFCPQPDLTLGIKPHTDPCIITILLQNEIQGLQVVNVENDDEWVDVNPVPGGLVVNIGDFLQIVSNGEYKSVKHRVVANANKEPRISVVTFFHLTKWREHGCYGPLQELVTPEKPAMYRDFTVQEFHDNVYGKGLDSKSLVDKIALI